jgi:magnesium chelatase subunit I
MDDGADSQVIQRIVQQAILNAFKARVPMDSVRAAIAVFDEGMVVHAGDDVASSQLVEVLATIPALRRAVSGLAGSESPASLAAATELVLEGLHLSKRLNKDASGSRSTYRAR